MMMVRVLYVVVLGVGSAFGWSLAGVGPGLSLFLAGGLVGGVAGWLVRQSCWCLW